MALHIHLVSLRISKLFLQTVISQHWVADNSSYNSSTQIQQIPCCNVFPGKRLSGIVDIFCKSSEINHKPPLNNSKYVLQFSHSQVLLELLFTQNKLICCAPLACGILNISV